MAKKLTINPYGQSGIDQNKRLYLVAALPRNEAHQKKEAKHSISSTLIDYIFWGAQKTLIFATQQFPKMCK